ncbi:MAG: hypothetical protein ACI31D_09635 [Candidatus Limisoma sp.]
MIEFGKGEEFYELANADGKRWLVPRCGLGLALCLYQPSGFRGKLLKRFYPLLHLSAVRRRLGVAVRQCRLDDDFAKLVCKSFGNAPTSFAAFFGTPCVHQKTTIQLCCSDRISGYAKTTKSDEVAQLFAREQRILARLAEQGVTGIPQITFVGRIRGEHVMLQTTTKTRRSQTRHRWDALHQAFVDSLRSKTRTTMPYEQSDFAADVDFLKANHDELPDWAQESASNAVADVERRYSGRQTEFMAYHADFTPWNMFVERGRLFVFDWEYARTTYPCGLDRYHFELQTAYFERHATADEAFMAIESASWFTSASCIDYLVGIVSLYLRREGNAIKSNPMLRYWVELLRKNLCK